MDETNHVIIVAIDGPSAAGKGTLARKIAEQFNWLYLDTGLLYRALGALCVNHGIPLAPEYQQEIVKLIPLLNAAFLQQEDLRTEEAGQRASKIAPIPEVRAALTVFQRNIPDLAQEQGRKGIVMDGRDIGSIVFPHADVKLFVTASAEVRAQRRVKELVERGISADFNLILEDLKARDERDRTRSIAPLLQAKDALEIDTSSLSAEEALTKALEIICHKLNFSLTT